MNSLTIPPSTNWYLPNTILCTPDNTLIYGSRSDIVIMFNEESELLQDRPPSVKILPRVHSQKYILQNQSYSIIFIFTNFLELFQ